MRAHDGPRLVGSNCAWDHWFCLMRAGSERCPGEKAGVRGNGPIWVAGLWLMSDDDWYLRRLERRCAGIVCQSHRQHIVGVARSQMSESGPTCLTRPACGLV